VCPCVCLCVFECICMHDCTHSLVHLFIRCASVLVCGAASAGQLGLGTPLEDVPTLTLVAFPAEKSGGAGGDDDRFACDVGVGWECTIVVTHVRERPQDASIGSISSGSRLRGASDCSDASDLPLRDAPSPSASDASASFLVEGSTAGKCSHRTLSI